MVEELLIALFVQHEGAGSTRYSGCAKRSLRPSWHETAPRRRRARRSWNSSTGSTRRSWRRASSVPHAAGKARSADKAQYWDLFHELSIGAPRREREEADAASASGHWMRPAADAFLGEDPHHVSPIPDRRHAEAHMPPNP